MKITNFKLLNKGVVIAIFSISVEKWGGFLIHNCALMKAGDKSWIAFPNRPYEADGKKKYFSYCGFEKRETEDLFKEKIKALVDEHIKTMSPKQEEPSNFNDEMPF